MHKRLAALLGSAMIGALAMPAVPAAAHPGGLNSEGCHNNRKTGDYHCHRGAARRSAPPARAESRGGQVYYANCDAVRAAGKAPLRRGDPGYRPALDRDSDGFACEYSRFNPR
uniref:excalibur calcium-binding domain-containing protein n=1 Tax=Parerythrobacter lutipelagi TaxID=1964208 RepID=UPI001F01A3A6|nr:excalibur calcium-binding domain-containing protein [Parerythrobacter lutipelagi]